MSTRSIEMENEKMKKVKESQEFNDFVTTNVSVTTCIYDTKIYKQNNYL